MTEPPAPYVTATSGIITLNSINELPACPMYIFSLAAPALQCAKDHGHSIVYYYPKNWTYYVPVVKP